MQISLQIKCFHWPSQTLMPCLWPSMWNIIGNCSNRRFNASSSAGLGIRRQFQFWVKVLMWVQLTLMCCARVTTLWLPLTQGDGGCWPGDSLSSDGGRYRLCGSIFCWAEWSKPNTQKTKTREKELLALITWSGSVMQEKQATSDVI